MNYNILKSFNLKNNNKMYNVFDRLFIGSISDCRYGDEKWAIVHACKFPCHQNAVKCNGDLSPSHPHYLSLELERDLYLNMIDPLKPLFKRPLFIDFLTFSNKQWINQRKILIHCERGESRAPSLALTFLAKSIHVVSNFSFKDAMDDFLKLFPFYRPGLGIQTYLENNWATLDKEG